MLELVWIAIQKLKANGQAFLKAQLRPNDKGGQVENATKGVQDIVERKRACLSDYVGIRGKNWASLSDIIGIRDE